MMLIKVAQRMEIMKTFRGFGCVTLSVTVFFIDYVLKENVLQYFTSDDLIIMNAMQWKEVGSVPGILPLPPHLCFWTVVLSHRKYG